jgi:hypothetical protein
MNSSIRRCASRRRRGEIEAIARGGEGAEGGIEMAGRLVQLARQRRRVAIRPGLDAFVGKARGGAHHRPREAVRLQLARGIDAHVGDEDGPVLERAQRAEVVGQALGQHRHDAVREIDGIAAALRVEVERGARTHVPGDVRDRDADAPSAAGGIRLGMDGVVEVARVGAVDRHQRQVAQVEAIAHRRGRGIPRLGEGARIELHGDVVQGQRDRARGARRVLVAQPLDHLGARALEAPRGEGPRDHEFPVAGLAVGAVDQREFHPQAPVRRLDDAPGRRAADHADHAFGQVGGGAQEPRAPEPSLARCHADHAARALAKARGVEAPEPDARGRARPQPFDGRRDRLAGLEVQGGDAHEQDIGVLASGIRRRPCSLARRGRALLRDLLGDLGEHRLEGQALLALQAQRARDGAAIGAGVLAQEREDAIAAEFLAAMRKALARARQGQPVGSAARRRPPGGFLAAPGFAAFAFVPFEAFAAFAVPSPSPPAASFALPARPPLRGLPPPAFAARSSMRRSASSSCTSSGLRSFGRLA